MQGTSYFGTSCLGNTTPEFALVTETLAALADSDENLVRVAQRGHREAFGQLYQRYVPMVHGILLAKLPRLEVEDLVHEVFLRALSRLRGLRDASRFGAWIAAIARNMANDYYRDPRAHVQHHDHSVETDVKASPKGQTQAQTREAAEILEIIRSLPEAYRETLVLRLVEGMTGPEIAARTGLSHGSVRVNLHRGMQQLRDKLERKSAPAGSRP
jgi:RNA polymerase sigma-70 factor (ECF subfamily)